jgi:hypothetical protein
MGSPKPLLICDSSSEPPGNHRLYRELSLAPDNRLAGSPNGIDHGPVARLFKISSCCRTPLQGCAWCHGAAARE